MVFTKRRGLIMITVLLILVVVIMMTTALLNLNRMDLFQGAHYKDRLRALEMARGGLNHAAEVLAYDPSSTTSINYSSGSVSYSIRFSGTSSTRSVNNLMNLAPHPQSNFRGDQVPGHAADLICIGRAGNAQVKVRGLLKRGFNITSSVASVGRVLLDGDVTLDGISSLHNPQPLGGGITSLYSTAGPGDEAIRWTGLGTFEMLGDSELETGPVASSTADSISANLKSQFPNRVREGGASEPPPRFQVAQTVSGGSSHPAPLGMTTGGGVNTLGYSNVNDERHVSGALVVNGDLSLSGGTLYVDGDLTLNGGIHGTGSVFVNGDISVNGGNSVLLTNQSKGAALFASGDVSMTGIDAAGYLDSLALAHPQVNAAKTQLTSSLSTIQTRSQAAVNGTTATDLWNDVRELAWDQPDTSNYWLSPIPGPNGSHALGSQHSPLPSTINAIKSSLGSSYATDAKARKVVQALEQTHHNFRFNLATAATGSVVDPSTYTIAGVTPADFFANHLQIEWDDNVLLAEQPPGMFDAWSLGNYTANGPRYNDLTLDHQWRASGGSANSLAPHLVAMRNQMFQQVTTFFDHHPLDFSWLGHSYFQGLVYAEGNVAVDNQFQVVGGLFSGGEVALSGGSKLTFDGEYMEFDGALGPVYVAAYEEF